ncbi:MAG: hypothetical protein J6I31_03100 [Prevotella sp.]|nr:hypothetical protein [Prevotella sp.]
MTKTLKFKCTLESDLVLSQTSSSEGNQKTLDFIPGNNFLGIVAGKLYDDGSTESLKLFHSGKVRFGDAHPSVDGIRGLKIPASMYYPKLASASEECYIHHLTDHNSPDIKSKQLKQCREGFYSFGETTGKPIAIEKNFTIKSAYDSDVRRSKDGQMFGYESLSKGLVMYFEVESELSDEMNEKIIKSLCGKKHIGHSRSAEFGLVTIEQKDFKEVSSTKSNTEYATVYADGRLIFLDENGYPTCQPTAKGLGVDGGEVDWSKSQIRTFQYAPWNGKRHTYEADRCGIEKGSVFVVNLNGAACPEKSQYVGSYKNEGFGKVIYNPVFLAGKPDEQGKALFTLEEKKQEENATTNAPKPNSALIDFLTNKKKTADSNQTVYQIVQKVVKDIEQFFKKGKFASQWGSIRSLAMITSDSQELIKAIDAFLDHGVAKDKWEEQNRKGRLDVFMQQHVNEDLQSIMINLASEMAKKCKAREED